MLERIAQAVWATMIMASPIGADLSSGWIEDGTAARIAEWKRHEGAARQAIARRVLATGSDTRRIRPARTSGSSCRRDGRRKAFVAQARSPRRRSLQLRRLSSRVGIGAADEAVRCCVSGTPTHPRAAASRRWRASGECLLDRAPTARAVV